MPESKNPLLSGPEKGDITHFLEIENPNTGIEPTYFWVLQFLKNNSPSGIEFTDIIKVRDLNTGTESSTYFGMIEQRKSIQQERVSQYLATLGKMTKDLFQMIRELRIMDERNDYYKNAKKGDDSAIIALKSIWIDQVEGGAKNPSSVLGLASRDIGFVTLPDLFFKIHPVLTEKDKEKNISINEIITRTVEGEKQYGLNSKIKEILKRKLFQFYTWKEKTEKEILQRRKFVLGYLKQHYHTMRLYINWLKPYLQNVGNLQLDIDEFSKSPELIRSFNTTKIQIEILASKPLKGDEKKDWEDNKLYRPFIKILFDYTAIPQLAYQQEQQRGAIHMGLTKIYIEGHPLLNKHIKEYEKEKEKEDIEILKSLNDSLNSLGDELLDYLTEADDEYSKSRKEKIEEYNKICNEKNIKPKDVEKLKTDEIDELIESAKEAKTPKTENTVIQTLDGFKEITNNISSGFKSLLGKTQDKQVEFKLNSSKDKAKGAAKTFSYVVYDIYKKAHGMLAW